MSDLKKYFEGGGREEGVKSFILTDSPQVDVREMGSGLNN